MDDLFGMDWALPASGVWDWSNIRTVAASDTYVPSGLTLGFNPLFTSETILKSVRNGKNLIARTYLSDIVPKNDSEAIAIAVLKGDEAAAMALIDKLMEERSLT